MIDLSALDWPKETRILVILAHPDDPEFFLGGTIAMWTQAGYQVDYGLLTDGELGLSEAFPDSVELAKVRHNEQRAAADALGVSSITWFGYPDGFLVPDLEKRKVIARFIRQMKPNVVVSSDPTSFYLGENYLNHPDHRAAGQIVAEGLFPAVGNRGFFPELLSEGYEPHQVSELWMSLPANKNIDIDVTDYWDFRVKALLNHLSQVGTPDVFMQRMQDRRNNAIEGPDCYVESFRRIVFRK
jgi:LmbE family N-acetylglucosaminyl deacetylase